MKFSYSWLKEYVPKILAPEQVAADLSRTAFEVENVEAVGEDSMLDIKVLANRAHDCLAHLGVAREAAAAQNKEFKEPAIKFKEDKSLLARDLLTVEVQEPKLCPRYSARVVIDIKVGDSPQWMQERLKICGLRPINNIVDITNYVMLECGQPLHAFDLDKVVQQRIIVRKAKKGEKIITLDEGRAQRVLNDNILVIADPKGAIGIAGIKGGRGTEIDVKTTRVALEAANFDPINVRKSSKALALRTDASWRFENEPDINLTVWALDRAAALLAGLTNGRVASGIIDIAARKQVPWNVAVAHSYVESLLGVKIKPEQIVKILSRLDLSIKQFKKKTDIFYEVKVPTRRGDLLTGEDLIEEIGRFFGYENIPAKMPEGTLIPALENENLIYTDELRDILTGLGYSEVYNYSFIGENDKNLYSFNDLVEVSNPLSQEQKYLRPNLAAGLIKNLRENIRYFKAGSAAGLSLDSLRLFEFGHVFGVQGGKVSERKKLGGLIYLPGQGAKDKPFYELKGTAEMLFNRLGLADVWGDELAQQELPADWKFILSPKRAAHIHEGKQLIGWLGEISPVILEQMDAVGRAAIFEIDFEKMVQLVDEERIYQPPSKYPAMTRDLAMLVEANTPVESLMSLIENTAGELLADIKLFDVYDGNDLPSEQKSLAFRLIWQSPERNLSDVEINKQMEKIIRVLEEEGWEVRK